MKKKSTRTIVVSLALVAIAIVWFMNRGGDDSWESEEDAARRADPALLFDRVWVDSKPEKYTDYTHAMLAVSHAPIGVFQKASSYQATIELFEYTRKDGVLVAHFPQSGNKRETRYRIRECSDLPPFDLCLDLSHNPWGGPRRYYGMMEQDDEAAELGELRHQLEHKLANPGNAD
jgi:hypothetical protein